MSNEPIQIFRFLPSHSKKIFERFSAVLRNVEIREVQVKYEENGQIERVDILYIDRDKKVKLI